MWYQVAVMEKRQHVRKSVEARSLFFGENTEIKDFVLRRISDVLFCRFSIALVFVLNFPFLHFQDPKLYTIHTTCLHRASGRK